MGLEWWEMSKILKLKPDAKPFATEDFLYDLFYGGYIKPSEILEEESAKKVCDAVSVVLDFIQLTEESGIFEEV